MRLLIAVPLALLVAAGCDTITEDLPTRPVIAPSPIVIQIPQPAPVPPAVPTRAPQPTAQPTATAAPQGENNGAPPTQVGVGVTSYLRNGRLIPSGAASYKPGDVLYLTCTPKGANNRPTDNHGPLEGWNVWSNNLADSDWGVTSTESFNPDVHVSPACGAGEIQAYCQVNGIRSNTLVIRIVP